MICAEWELVYLMVLQWLSQRLANVILLHVMALAISLRWHDEAC